MVNKKFLKVALIVALVALALFFLFYIYINNYYYSNCSDLDACDRWDCKKIEIPYPCRHFDSGEISCPDVEPSERCVSRFKQ